MPYFLLLFFYFLPFSCRFFENERFFTVYPLRVHAFFVEILKMNGKKRQGVYFIMSVRVSNKLFPGNIGIFKTSNHNSLG